MASQLVISEQQVTRALQPRACTDALERSFRDWGAGLASNAPRARAVLGKQTLHSLSAVSEALGRAACKSYLAGPGGVRFQTLLYGLQPSELLASIESARLGQLRTGCASALAARYLAPQGPLRLGLIGSGNIAQGQLEALHAEFADRLVEVRCWSRKGADRLRDYAYNQLGRSVVEASSAQHCVAEANLVVTATSAGQPVLLGEWLSESGGLLCAAGNNQASRRELDDTAVRRCRWTVDSVDQARGEAGEFLAVSDFDWAALRELKEFGPAATRGWTGFKSLGVGIEDLAAASLIYDEVMKLERG